MDFLSSINDFRRLKSVKYCLGELLACLIIATLYGNSSTFQAVAWCKTHLDLLRSLGLVLINGIASYDTFQRVLRLLNSQVFSLEFINWMNEVICCSGLHLAIDGKGLRGGTDRIRNGKTPYMLNIIETSNKIIIASIPIDEKTNELKSIPEALALIAIAGNVFTIDAVGTFMDIILQILNEKGNFVLLVKKNNPEAYEKLTAYFNAKRSEAGDGKASGRSNQKEDDPNSTGWTFEKNRDRHEYRRCETVLNTLDEKTGVFLGEEVLGPTSVLGAHASLFGTIGMVTSVRIPIEYDKETGMNATPKLQDFLEHGSVKKPHPTYGDSEQDDIQCYGILSNMSLTAAEILQFKRQHWNCEATHHILDVTFREDFSSAKDAKFNQSLIRKLAYNLVKLAI